MPIQLDPEDSETTALLAYADFTNKRVLEIGCGDGRLTWRYAEHAAQVIAIDPEKDRIEAAIKDTPEYLKDRVEFLVSGIEEFTLAKVELKNSPSIQNPSQGFSEQEIVASNLAEGSRSNDGSHIQPLQGVKQGFDVVFMSWSLC
jgi:predicted RNA methylase